MTFHPVAQLLDFTVLSSSLAIPPFDPNVNSYGSVKRSQWCAPIPKVHHVPPSLEIRAVTLRRATRPSPLHFLWHSSNVPGLGRQPQAPSSAAPAALEAAVPGVRSEPRPAPAPAPSPPPRDGSVKPGGEGGGGGSPTRAGAGGGGGPAGGELAANTFPMVACEGRCQRAEVRPCSARAQPKATPTLF